ncbi:hypothetical protein J8I26_17540 [Herbaspirillum sp. LeCh32-8]|uniref:hypothetical protein n=1 Tax=Herbaspirillum sp. LeCh32-8 TaxID=2821356 RepID=UPI001AE7FFD2|nr:hypothetical protein [Herbaspirillum sp. LeCh32-8]MBP0599917.1 hypothetical protein [Herbaspirillum sp. LeCh32-8]
MTMRKGRPLGGVDGLPGFMERKNWLSALVGWLQLKQVKSADPFNGSFAEQHANDGRNSNPLPFKKHALP